MDNPGSTSSYPTVVVVDEGKDGDDDSAPPAAKRARKENQNGSPDDVLSALPDEILLPILSHLGTMDLARVCGVNRRFRDLCRDVALQKRLEIRGVSEDNESEVLEEVERLNNLEELVVIGENHNCVRVSCRALERCPSLGTVQIEGCGGGRMDPSSLLTTIGSRGKSLRILKINNPILKSEFRRNVQFLGNLTHLELRYVTKDQLRAIVDHCKKLKHFYFHRCQDDLNDDDISHYLEGLKDSLEEISIDERFKSNSMLDIVKCEKLRRVKLMLRDLPNTKTLAGETLKSIVKLPMLRELEITYCKGYGKGCLSVRDMLEAFTGQKSIEVLSLANFPAILDDTTLAAIAYGCSDSLTNLTLSYCKGVTGEGIGRILHECKKLVRLHVNACTVSREAFTDVRAPLRSMKFTSMGMGNGVLPAIADACCHSLTSLTLSWCSGVTGRCVGRILRECKQLVDLELSRCKVSREAFRHVRAPLRSLACDCLGVDDKALVAIAVGCRKSLSSLTLQSCWSVTDEGVGKILQKCEKLVNLHLGGCSVSSEAFRDIRAPLRYLKCEDSRMNTKEVEAIKKRLGIST